jgi:hypothetical protein
VNGGGDDTPSRRSMSRRCARDQEANRICDEASKGLPTIDSHDKQQNVGSLKLARDWLPQSEVVYILRYGSMTTTIPESDLMLWEMTGKSEPHVYQLKQTPTK